MATPETTVLSTLQLSIGYTDGERLPKVVAAEINIQLKKGELICLLGANGSGKSTFIRTLAGIQAPLGGTIELGDTQLTHLSLLEIAKKLSLVLTESIASTTVSVYEIVTLGRMPYTNWMGKVTAADKEKVAEAIRITGIENYSHRKLTTLSDGEKQKVMIARALAQDTALIILDEPTAHLDLPSRIEVMRLLRKLTRETGKSVIISTHELDLALQAADKIWLMNRNDSFKIGVPEDLIINGSFAVAFQKEGIEFDPTTGTFKIHESQQHIITLKGNGHIAFWTKKALLREGITTTTATTEIGIEIMEQNGSYSWITNIEEERKTHTTIEALLITLRKVMGR
jgi:iron complex transport system ATP-binding protein